MSGGKTPGHCAVVINLLRGTDATGFAPEVGLLTTLPDDATADPGVEAAYVGYTRFLGLTLGSNVVQANGSVMADSSIAVEWPELPEDVDVVGVGIWAPSEAGPRAWGAVAVAGLAGETLRIPAGDLHVVED